MFLQFVETKFQKLECLNPNIRTRDTYWQNFHTFLQGRVHSSTVPQHNNVLQGNLLVGYFQLDSKIQPDIQDTSRHWGSLHCLRKCLQDRQPAAKQQLFKFAYYFNYFLPLFKSISFTLYHYIVLLLWSLIILTQKSK